MLVSIALSYYTVYPTLKMLTTLLVHLFSCIYSIFAFTKRLASCQLKYGNNQTICVHENIATVPLFEITCIRRRQQLQPRPSATQAAMLGIHRRASCPTFWPLHGLHGHRAAMEVVERDIIDIAKRELGQAGGRKYVE